MHRLFDAMFSDMDINLRELGVGDMGVARNVRAMWEAFHGRATVYEAAIDSDDPAALGAALARNIWRGEAAPGAPALTEAVRAMVAQLDAATLPELTGGRFRFASPVPA